MVNPLPLGQLSNVEPVTSRIQGESAKHNTADLGQSVQSVLCPQCRARVCHSFIFWSWQVLKFGVCVREVVTRVCGRFTHSHNCVMAGGHQCSYCETGSQSSTEQKIICRVLTAVRHTVVLKLSVVVKQTLGLP